MVNRLLVCGRFDSPLVPFFLLLVSFKKGRGGEATKKERKKERENERKKKAVAILASELSLKRQGTLTEGEGTVR